MTRWRDLRQPGRNENRITHGHDLKELGRDLDLMWNGLEIFILLENRYLNKTTVATNNFIAAVLWVVFFFFTYKIKMHYCIRARILKGWLSELTTDFRVVHKQCCALNY